MMLAKSKCEFSPHAAAAILAIAAALASVRVAAQDAQCFVTLGGAPVQAELTPSPLLLTLGISRRF